MLKALHRHTKDPRKPRPKENFQEKPIESLSSSAILGRQDHQYNMPSPSNSSLINIQKKAIFRRGGRADFYSATNTVLDVGIASFLQIRHAISKIQSKGLSGGGAIAAGRAIAIEEYISNPVNFSHSVLGYTMSSIHHRHDGTYPNGMGGFFPAPTKFVNKFKPHKWTFKENYRYRREATYYASDIAKYQYNIVSGMHGFRGQLPSVIKRKQVTNKDTLSMTHEKESDELFSLFFQSPNGKSTSHILNDFGMKAIEVERIDRWGEESADFIITIAPHS